MNRSDNRGQANDLSDDSEWLEADGLGAFASGPARGPRTRRYHALLLTATTPPTGRVVLINGVEASVERLGVAIPLSTNHYLPDVIYPDGWRHLKSFNATPWPCWIFDLGDDVTITHEIFVARDTCETVLTWHLSGSATPCSINVRPLLTGRDYHALHRENPGFDFNVRFQGGNVAARPYASLPTIGILTNGEYRHDPMWFRNVLYTAEQLRGLDFVEDVASTGVFTWDLATGDAVMILRAGDGLNVRAAPYAKLLREAERMRRTATTPLDIAADSYLVDRGAGGTVIAGFPWFTDWGRDTFIAMRGLVLARGRLELAEAILCAWAGAVSEGMVPNRFVDDGGAPEYNAVDASLWFIIASHEFLQAAPASPEIETRLRDAADAILAAYSRGTRHGIAADTDGLLRAGVPGLQLTWMDAKIGDHVITPRIGKPVEIQALWINALHIGADWSPRWGELEGQAHAAFLSRFIQPDGGLFDVVDADHVAGNNDARIRPNQIFAVGGLPFAMLAGDAAGRVVEQVEAHLLTPLGLRTLAPTDPEYQPRYADGPAQRDAAYHQGTVWPWLIGPFVEAWLRGQGNTKEAADEARRRFLPPLLAHLQTAGLGHVSEVADGDAPHTPGGCPFQAWSLGELIRVQKLLDRLTAA